MRSYWISAALALMPVGAMAQGWIMPRPCIMPLDDRPIVRPAIRDCGPTVVRTRSDVRAELVGNGASRVIRFEVEERFVNNFPVASALVEPEEDRFHAGICCASPARKF